MDYSFEKNVPDWQPQADGSSDQVAVPVSVPKLLIVDGHPAICIILRQIFEKRGCDVEIAADAYTALNRFDTFCPDIELIDIGLPGMDGYQLAKKIRETRPSSQLMLVAVTGFGHENDRKKSNGAGFDLHLVKPLAADDMIEVMIENRPQLKSHFSRLTRDS